MVALIIFLLLTFAAGCFVVGSVVVEARQMGRVVLPIDEKTQVHTDRSRQEEGGQFARERSTTVAVGAR